VPRTGWLAGVFRSRAVTAILDRVDDNFLVNHPNMDLSYVVDTLRGVVGRYRDNLRFAVVAPVRSDIQCVERLASNPRDVVEVLPGLPTCRRWLAHVSDPLNLVLTPLSLSNLEPEGGPRAFVLSEDRPVGRVLDLRADTDRGDEGPELQARPARR
jgi:hypothetical protein